MVEPPVKASVPSSATVCVPAPGTVLTGGSFTLVTVTLTVAVSVTPAGLVTVQVKLSVPLKLVLGV